MNGKNIAHYQVGEKLGAGGMGEVWQATDSKLNRQVALKILPERFASDSERMGRFQREAHVLAALNHPNIAAIYGFEEHEGTHAFVLELVEGPTLADVIRKGPIALDEALAIAVQIAEALEAAHNQNIIHRDLKPANIKVRNDGTVKVLDFGLAKALEDPQSEQDIPNSPTLSAVATRAGIILGTAAYMSPEQARGRAADRRADIWAFGVVLFEMLSGKQAFSGETVSDILASVLKNDLDWELLPADTPPQVVRLLRRCLTPDRKQRLQAIGEARIGITELRKEPLEGSVPMSAPAAVERKPGWTRALPWVLTSVFGLVTAVAVWNAWQTSAPRTGFRLKVEVSPDDPLDLSTGAAAVLSPDGKTLAYVAKSGGTSGLYTRSLDSLESNLLSGTEGARSPFFSPDGRWLGFFTESALKKVAVSGGAPVTLTPTQVNRGGTWGEDGTIVFASNITSGLSRIPASGGTPEEITIRGTNERSHRWPFFLPGGKSVLFITQMSSGDYYDATVEAVTLDGGERKALHYGGTYPQYLPSGHLIFVREGTLFAVPFDPDRLETMGTPFPIIDGISAEGDSGGNGGAQYTFSAGGTFVYHAGSSVSNMRTIARVDRAGSITTLLEQPDTYWEPSIAPDETRVAVTKPAGKAFEIWTVNLPGGSQTRLTFDGVDTYQPVWSADGKRVAFSSNVGSRSVEGGAYHVYWKPADGSANAEQLTRGGHDEVPVSFSPDGKYLIYEVNSPVTKYDLWVLPLEGDRDPEAFLATPAVERWGEFSPDSRWVVYTSSESDRNDVFVGPFPGPGGKWQVSTEGGYMPHWTKGGREIVYRAGDAFFAASVSVEGSRLRIGTPELLFKGEFFNGLESFNYDVSADGSWFVLMKHVRPEGDSADANHLTFIFDFFDLVSRVAGSGDD